MNPVAKLVLFGIVLVASFGAGAAIGAALPDLGPDEPVEQPQEGHP
jgi:hypothetical protein